MKRPDRKPDYIDEKRVFWFEEMIQAFGEEFCHTDIYELKLTNKHFLWKNIKYGVKFSRYWAPLNDRLLIAYKKWLISKALKEKLNEENL